MADGPGWLDFQAEAPEAASGASRRRVVELTYALPKIFVERSESLFELVGGFVNTAELVLKYLLDHEQSSRRLCYIAFSRMVDALSGLRDVPARRPCPETVKHNRDRGSRQIFELLVGRCLIAVQAEVSFVRSDGLSNFAQQSL